MMVSAIAAPHTYSEWVAVLDMLKAKSNDEAVLGAMLQGTIEWQSGVAERFAKKLVDVINYRMNGASDRFQKEMARAYGQERGIVQDLLALRKEMLFLSKAINLPVIPEKDREQYHQLVITQANKMQSSLEDSAKKDRTGKLLSICVVTLIFCHIFINIGMTVRIVPITGLPLPFISQGGTFMLVMMMAMGFLQSVAVHSRSTTAVSTDNLF